MKPEITVIIVDQHVASYSITYDGKYYETTSAAKLGEWIEKQIKK